MNIHHNLNNLYNGLMDKLDVNIHHNYSISSIFDFGLVFCVIVEGLKHCGHDYLQYAGNLTVQIIILLNIDGVLYFNFVIPSRCVIECFGHFIILNMLKYQISVKKYISLILFR